MSSQSQPPREDRLRASDADRDQTVELLASATAEGRLTLEEYSERSGSALSARTMGELAALTEDVPAAPARYASGSPTQEISALLGNEVRKGSWVVPPHLTVRSVLGDCHLEMQHAVMRQHVTTIDAIAKFGAVTIYVPDGIEVRMSGRNFLGATSSQLQGEPRPGAPVIEVRCDVLCGAVTVRRPAFFMR